MAKESLADRVALRIAKSELIEKAFKHGKVQLIGNDIEPLDEPLDLKCARIIVNDFGDYPEALQASVALLDVSTRYEVNMMMRFVKENIFDTILEVASLNMESRNKLASDLFEKLEVKNNERVTSEKAVLIRQTADKLPSMRSQKTIAEVERFRRAVAQAIGRHPEFLKPFSEEKPASEALQRSRARVQGLVQSVKSPKQ